jgi:cation diffusion facilitator CzcD-associated flavoprotein CzcO
MRILMDNDQPADVVVLPTEFQPTRLLWSMRIHGRGGTDLHEQWGYDNASAYLGVGVPNYPSLFLIGGPHAFIGHRQRPLHGRDGDCPRHPGC